jgi:RimJ/RimL family protein N-acetyltransferase
MELRIDRATLAECRFIYDIAMDPSVRQMSTRPDAFSFEDHERWFAERLSDPETLFLTGADGPDLVGYVRYHRDRRAAEVSIAVAPRHRGRGYGTELLRLGDPLAFETLGIDSITALVLPKNVASQRTFTHAGYREAGSEERAGQLHLRYEKRPQ